MCKGSSGNCTYVKFNVASTQIFLFQNVIYLLIWQPALLNFCRCVQKSFFQLFMFRFLSPFQPDSSSVKVKCTAMLLSVYLKSNEISFEVKQQQQLSQQNHFNQLSSSGGGAMGSLVPALESRDGKIKTIGDEEK